MVLSLNLLLWLPYLRYSFRAATGDVYWIPNGCLNRASGERLNLTFINTSNRAYTERLTKTYNGCTYWINIRLIPTYRGRFALVCDLSVMYVANVLNACWDWTARCNGQSGGRYMQEADGPNKRPRIVHHDWIRLYAGAPSDLFGENSVLGNLAAS